jgi:hypothetical protein
MRYQTARDLLIDLKNLRRDLDFQGELDRSVAPNAAPRLMLENEKQVLAPKTLVGETNAASDAETFDLCYCFLAMPYPFTEIKQEQTDPHNKCQQRYCFAHPPWQIPKIVCRAPDVA